MTIVLALVFGILLPSSALWYGSGWDLYIFVRCFQPKWYPIAASGTYLLVNYNHLTFISLSQVHRLIYMPYRVASLPLPQVFRLRPSDLTVRDVFQQGPEESSCNMHPESTILLILLPLHHHNYVARGYANFGGILGGRKVHKPKMPIRRIHGKEIIL